MEWVFPVWFALFMAVIWPAIVMATDPSNRFFNPEGQSEPEPVDPVYGDGACHDK